MKAIFEIEDAIAGIICGLLILGYVGKFFTLKLHSSVYVIAFVILIIFIVLDLINEFKDLGTHLGLITLSIVHNIADLVISLAFISYFTELNIPYITAYLVPYLQSESMIAGIGMFLVIGNGVWLFLFPFAS